MNRKLLSLCTLFSVLSGLAADASRLVSADATPQGAPADEANEEPSTDSDGGANAGAVSIMLATAPPTSAWVFWGRKRLGRILPGKPLVVTRPRDSGPLDIMVRSEAFLPVQTRVYTFADAKITVQLTPPDRKNALFGYRAPLDAGILDASTTDGALADSGVAEAGDANASAP